MSTVRRMCVSVKLWDRFILISPGCQAASHSASPGVLFAFDFGFRIANTSVCIALYLSYGSAFATDYGCCAVRAQDSDTLMHSAHKSIRIYRFSYCYLFSMVLHRHTHPHTQWERERETNFRPISLKACECVLCPASCVLQASRSSHVCLSSNQKPKSRAIAKREQSSVCQSLVIDLTAFTIYVECFNLLLCHIFVSVLWVLLACAFCLC